MKRSECQVDDKPVGYVCECVCERGCTPGMEQRKREERQGMEEDKCNKDKTLVYKHK